MEWGSAWYLASQHCGSRDPRVIVIVEEKLLKAPLDSGIITLLDKEPHPQKAPPKKENPCTNSTSVGYSDFSGGRCRAVSSREITISWQMHSSQGAHRHPRTCRPTKGLGVPTGMQCILLFHPPHLFFFCLHSPTSEAALGKQGCRMV